MLRNHFIIGFEEHLLVILVKWKFEYDLHYHTPVKTVNQSREIQGSFLKSESGGCHVKNLYLRDRKKKNELLVK